MHSASKRHERSVDHWMDALYKVAAVLVLPLSCLLFLQWPLREWVQAYSREANDLAQCLFALYVSIAISYTTRMRMHLAADAFARRYPEAVRMRMHRIAALVVLLPWAVFMLWSMAPTVWRSLAQLERFPETWNPGYFVLKLALALGMLLVIAQALLELIRSERG